MSDYNFNFGKLEWFIEWNGDRISGIKEFVREVDADLRANQLYEFRIGLTFDNAKRRAGQFRPRSFEMSLSRLYVEHATVESIENTILHEFAHALDWSHRDRSDHGEHWKRWCRELGMTRIDRCTDGSELATMPRGRYEARCLKCGATEVAFMWKRTKTEYVHKACDGDLDWVDLREEGLQV